MPQGPEAGECGLQELLAGGELLPPSALRQQGWLGPTWVGVCQPGVSGAEAPHRQGEGSPDDGSAHTDRPVSLSQGATHLTAFCTLLLSVLWSCFLPRQWRPVGGRLGSRSCPVVPETRARLCQVSGWGLAGP